jgi:hypothetical protein
MSGPRPPDHVLEPFPFVASPSVPVSASIVAFSLVLQDITRLARLNRQSILGENGLPFCAAVIFYRVELPAQIADLSFRAQLWT